MALTEEQKQACLGAAVYIQTYGFNKGGFFNWGATDIFDHQEVVESDTINPPACALGAIAKATRNDVADVQHDYQDLFNDDIPERYIQRWNDHPDTTAEDVIELLNKYGNS